MTVIEEMVVYIKKSMSMIVTNGEVRMKLKHTDLKTHIVPSLKPCLNMALHKKT